MLCGESLLNSLNGINIIFLNLIREKIRIQIENNDKCFLSLSVQRVNEKLFFTVTLCLLTFPQ